MITSCLALRAEVVQPLTCDELSLFVADMLTPFQTSGQLATHTGCEQARPGTVAAFVAAAVASHDGPCGHQQLLALI